MIGTSLFVGGSLDYICDLWGAMAAIPLVFDSLRDILRSFFGPGFPSLPFLIFTPFVLRLVAYGLVLLVIVLILRDRRPLPPPEEEPPGAGPSRDEVSSSPESHCESGTDHSSPEARPGDMEDLRRRIDELERRLDEMEGRGRDG